jgi:ABC-type multidrug transport system ATPase subunit
MTRLPAVELTDLSVTYRRGQVHALNQLNLTLPGGLVGLLGPNGAGKTTLLRVLAGILPPTSGAVRIGGNDLADTAARRRAQTALGYLPQELGLYPDLSARQFLDYLAVLKGVTDRADRRRRVSEVLELVALSKDAGHKLKTYSGGMKRRVGIAQAILADPRLLIVDEPTAGLDPEERLRFRNLLVALAGDRTVLLSTHIVDDITQTCPQVVVMDHGQIAYHGPTADLAKRADSTVWVLTRPAGAQPPDLPVIAVTPTPTGTSYRVISSRRPEPDAQPVPAAIEDGYLTLTRTNAASASGTSHQVRHD